jgi:hypothetical protein
VGDGPHARRAGLVDTARAAVGTDVRGWDHGSNGVGSTGFVGKKISCCGDCGGRGEERCVLR